MRGQAEPVGSRSMKVVGIDPMGVGRIVDDGWVGVFGS